jgi:hypothetical protein
LICMGIMLLFALVIFGFVAWLHTRSRLLIN